MTVQTPKRPSLPSREAWIEISSSGSSSALNACRFPRGKRGLKYIISAPFLGAILSLPSREAWIEIPFSDAVFDVVYVASLAGSVD